MIMCVVSTILKPTIDFWDFAQRNIFENDKKKKSTILLHIKPEVYFVQVISNEIEPKIDGICTYFSLEFDVL